ncbi:MAG: FAD-dependent oxidoreductase [Phocaeicola sp.]
MLLKEEINKRNHPHLEVNRELVIVGGGLSGVCCAIAAARKGMKVALIQDRPVLGGNGSSEIRVWALGATSHMGNNNRWAREGGVIGEIMVENLYRNKEGNPLLFDALLLDKVLAETNITLYLNTVVYDLTKSSNSSIESVIAYNPQNATSYQFKAGLFCDASGDGVLGFLSGATYRSEAEKPDEFDEGFSPSDKYGKLLGHTIFLYPKVTSAPVKYVAPEFALKDMSVIPKLHKITPDQTGCNYWWFEFGGNMDTIHESEDIKMELWRIVYGAWNHIKNSGLYPEAENMTLEWVGTIPGKRESRRFEGLYMMSQNDIVHQTHFDDSIAYGGWAIDLHPAEGIYSDLPSCNQYHSKGVYEIPYRSFVSKDITNLYFLGRLISASHVAFGSTRVMITSAFGGQAIGTAAALCKEKACMPAQLLSAEYMAELQQQLNINGQSIPHLPIDERRNLVSSAHSEVSSTWHFSELAGNQEWQPLNFSRAMILPLNAAQPYRFQVHVDLSEKTVLEVDLMVSEKPFNYTPDRVVEKLTLALQPGKQWIDLFFQNSIPTDTYAFLILRNNDLIKVELSDERVTGILSASNKFNLAVNNLGKQVSPPNSGFENFEFFTPDRRPEGRNLALKIDPPLDCFVKENLLNGYVRPYITPNAWVADRNEAESKVLFKWKDEKIVSEIKLYFDTDYDHPMETIQWNHPESVMPFCVREFKVVDGAGKLLAEVSENYQTIYSLQLKSPIQTSEIGIVLKRPHKNIPASLFRVEIK